MSNKIMTKHIDNRISRLNILFMARRFPPAVGGMEQFAFDLATALDDRHTLIKITWGGANKWLPLVLPVLFARGLWVLMTQSIDVIHMQDGVLAPIGWIYAKLTGKPYVVVTHGLDVTYSNTFYQAINVACIRQAGAVVAISTATMNEVLKRGVSAEKATVIPIGIHDTYGVSTVDRAFLQRMIDVDIHGRLVVLTTGRLVKRKGVAWFIEHALPEIVRQYPSVLYIVAGEGGQRQYIESSIRRMKLEGHVLMLGLVSQELRSALYQASDVFVMPNIQVPGDMEGFGIVALEAALAGLPIVASNLEGISDAIKDGENGQLVASEDSEGFIKEVGYLLASKEMRISRGSRARDYTLVHYGWEHITQAYTELYDQLLKK